MIRYLPWLQQRYISQSLDNKIHSTFKLVISGTIYKAVSKIQGSQQMKYRTLELTIARSYIHSRYQKAGRKNSYQNPLGLTYWVANLIRAVAFGKGCRHPMWTYREETWKQIPWPHPLAHLIYCWCFPIDQTNQKKMGKELYVIFKSQPPKTQNRVKMGSKWLERKI